ncbi:MAG: type IV pilus modification PilV family protein [Planctomycetota bacterium]|jgi:prepilin-type N-terminal cleavage/methylation domain-containing protein
MPKRPGFTLIETVASLVVLALAVPPMMWAIREVHVQRIDPLLTSRARWLAVEKIEDIIADRHSDNRGYTYLIPGNYTAETPVATDTAFNRTVTLNETTADLVTAGTGYMNVTVTVSWTDADGDAQSLAIATVLTDYTP